MSNQNKNQKIIQLFLPLAVFIFIIIFWELIVNIFHISQIIIVRPSQIYPVIVANYPLFMKEVLYTFTEVFFGWLIGNSIGIGLAIVLFSYKSLSKTIILLCVIVNAIPIIALSPIIGGFIGTGQATKIVIAAILCFFPMLIATLTGFTRISHNNQSLLKTYAASNWQNFFKLVLPNGLPYIMTTLRLNVITAIFGAIVSEFFGAHDGIGQMILANRGLYDLPMVWAALFYVVMMGSLFYFCIGLLHKLIVPWQQ